LDPDSTVPGPIAERFLELVRRRLSHEPVQYLLGWEEFRSLRLRVTPAVLIPRPETELLVEWGLELLPAPWGRAGTGAKKEGAGSVPVVVDLGTGSGAIALALAEACPGLMIYAVDRAFGAVALARENAIALGLADRVRFLEGDLYGPLGFLAGAVDLIVSNPPYIPSGALLGLPLEVRDYEPLEALDGGPEGLAVHRQIIARAPGFLKPGGRLLLEMGEGHSDRLAGLLRDAGFREIQIRTDLGGIERMIGARIASDGS
jgi:release factor glutamine methyltransferase